MPLFGAATIILHGIKFFESPPTCSAVDTIKMNEGCSVELRHRASFRSKYFQRKIAIIFLSINFNMCFGCLKELSHCDGSFEYPQCMFWLRNKKIVFSQPLLSWGLLKRTVTLLL